MKKTKTKPKNTPKKKTVRVTAAPRFYLEAGHPAELKAGARPPHTLSPALASRDGQLAAVFGTMGGDAQPQIVLQLAARLFHYGQSPAAAVFAGRWALKGPALYSLPRAVRGHRSRLPRRLSVESQVLP